MAPNTVSSVDRISNVVNPNTATAPLTFTEASDATYASEVKTVSEKPPADKAEPVKRPDVHLRFLIDPQSKQVTVLMLDRASQRVIRTIPADELSKMQEGQLIDLFS
jgi:uncharacterized FlaG/YvyC family protein